VRLLHGLARTRAVFDDPNLLPNAGLAPLLALADRAGLPELLAGVRPGGPCGAGPVTKAMCLVAGMAAGADCIEDMDLLRDGAMETVFGGVRAPSTLGSFLRSFTWGNVRQLDKAHRGLTAALAADPRLLPGREELAFIDVDSTQHRVYGYQKEGAGFGHAKVQGKSLLLKGLNPLISVISTPLAAPVLGPVRLRGGSTGSARGAAGLAAEATRTAREAGCTGKILVRFDSAFYNSAVIRTVIRHGAHFSVTAPANSSVRNAIAAIPEDAWTPIKYPQAVWDDQLECWVSDAEVTETEYTAFTSKKKSEQVTARLIVRRIRARNEKEVQGQGELFPVYRHHAAFTDSPFEIIQAESQHRGHAVVEQVIADLNAGPLACLPSGVFNANAAWLVLAAMAHNLLRAAGTRAGTRYAKARTATVRRDLITMPARTARRGRGNLVLHLPEGHHREQAWLNLWTEATGPPAAAA
jgi:Transposase DDE domain group 1